MSRREQCLRKRKPVRFNRRKKPYVSICRRSRLLLQQSNYLRCRPVARPVPGLRPWLLPRQLPLHQHQHSRRVLRPHLSLKNPLPLPHPQHNVLPAALLPPQRRSADWTKLSRSQRWWQESSLSEARSISRSFIPSRPFERLAQFTDLQPIFNHGITRYRHVDRSKF